jgi:tripartite-type tricarboxylate transporter receptor subunit TctC
MLALLASWVAAAAIAQPYPSKPIKIIAPFSPGASTDIVGRLLAAKLSESWGQSVFVENRAGAGGTIGATVAARSPADGYTLLMGSVASIGTAAGLYKNLPYDPIKDFAPITLGVRAASVLAVHPSLPVKSVKELIAFAKTRPNQLNYSSSGSGSPGHLAMELFNTMAGVRTTHIAYRGPAEALNDLIGGQVQLSIQSVVSALPFVNSGKLRALATSGRERLRELSQLPDDQRSGPPRVRGLRVVRRARAGRNAGGDHHQAQPRARAHFQSARDQGQAAGAGRRPRYRHVPKSSRALSGPTWTSGTK